MSGQKFADEHGSRGGGGEDVVTVTIVSTGGRTTKVLVKKNKHQTSEALRKAGFATKGFNVAKDGKQLKQNRDGSLAEDPLIDADTVITLSEEGLTGGR